MEKVITEEKLVSTGYRCLFECVKKEGIEPVFNLAHDVKNLPKQDSLINQTIMGEENDLDKLRKNNKDIIKYLKEHKKELKALSFKDLNVYNTLAVLLKESSLIDLYLDNAKELEKLKVASIRYLSPKDNELDYSIYRDINGDIINIRKYYTDGNICVGEETLEDEEFLYSKIPLYISSPSFILEVSNNESFYSYRAIMIKDFTFDSSKLPTKEELESYEVPRSLILTDDK